MLKRVIDSFKFSFSLFQLPKHELVFWLVIRAFTSAISPLMIPIIIRIMFNAIASRNLYSVSCSSIMLFVALTLCFCLSYYIYVFSDAWVMNSMYKFQSECLKRVIKDGNLQKRREKYSDGDISNILNQSAWSLIQIWLHIFRLLSPFIAVIILLVMQITTFWGLAILLAVSIVLDFAIIKIQGKKIYSIQKSIIDVEGDREQSLKYLFENIEFISLYDLQSSILDELYSYRTTSWALEWKKEKINIMFEFSTRLLDGLYTVAIWSIFGFVTDKIAVGKITSTNSIFDNLRTEVGKLKKQFVSTVGKIVPIEKQQKLLTDINSDSYSKFDLCGEDREDIVISVDNLSVEVDSNLIVNNVTFSIGENETVAIVGKNGAGKSTLLKSICDIYYSKMGEKYIRFGTDQVGYVPAEAFFFSQPTRDNIVMGYKKDSCLEKEYYENILCFSGLDNELDLQTQDASTLSGGQLKRMAIARALVNDDDVLIMDEPTAALDQETAEKVFARIMHLEKTIVFTTHNPSEIVYADRIIMISDGKIIFNNNLNNFFASDEYCEWCGIT